MGWLGSIESCYISLLSHCSSILSPYLWCAAVICGLAGLECTKKAHAENLRAATLAAVGMKASPHRSLNSSKGVTRTRDLGDLDEEEITSEVIKVYLT